MATSSDIDAIATELADDMRVARDLIGVGGSARDALSLDELRARVEKDQAAETGLLAQLRARPTGQRIGMVMATTLGLVGLTAVATPRPDLALYPALRMGVVVVALSALTAVALWRLLRPLHLPRPSLAATRALLVAGVLAPTLAALWPLHDHVGHAPGEGVAFLVGCGKCMAFGVLMGAPVLGLAALLRRARVDGAAVVALAGVAAGLTGNLTLQFHCPITSPLHMVVAHASLAALLGLVALRWR